MPELYDMPDRYSRIHPSARAVMADVAMEEELVRLQAIERRAREAARPPTRHTAYTTGYQHAARWILGEDS